MNSELANVPSVSELIFALKEMTENHFGEVMVEGEISNFSIASSGHVYFQLSDDQASLSSVLFRYDALRNDVKKIKDGDKVRCYGQVTVYAKRSQLQIIVKKIFSQGLGNFQLEFEKLKLKLTQEGLFDPQKKRKIPAMPQKIAIITALEGAALQDFLNVFQRRSFFLNCTIIPSLVQGEKAPHQLMKAYQKALAYGGFDVIVFTRGGGSVEDLWCFNHEELIRLVAQSPIPIISAIGHEIDWTLMDLVADLRCETPTAAAEILTQAQTHILERLHRSRVSLRLELTNLFQLKINKLMQASPKQLMAKIQKPWIEKTILIDDFLRRSKNIIEKKVLLFSHRIEQVNTSLSTLSPLAVLERGYVVLKANEHILSSAQDWDLVKENAKIELRFFDGVKYVQKS
jgi:exodeoxyribonuclease VII large subunit